MMGLTWHGPSRAIIQSDRRGMLGWLCDFADVLLVRQQRVAQKYEVGELMMTPQFGATENRVDARGKGAGETACHKHKDKTYKARRKAANNWGFGTGLIGNDTVTRLGFC